MALSCNPSLLIADEPTTALDVTIQAQILELMKELQQKLGMSLLLITHDLGVVAEQADEVAIMYAGKVVERAKAKEIFDRPLHPYTVGLLNSLPGAGNHKKKRLDAIPGMVPSPLELPGGCRFAHPGGRPGLGNGQQAHGVRRTARGNAGSGNACTHGLQVGGD